MHEKLVRIGAASETTRQRRGAACAVEALARRVALALVSAGAGCGPQPYGQIRTAPVATTTEVGADVNSSGIRLALGSQCEIRVLDMWCPLTMEKRAGCEAPPTIRKRETVACPRELDFKNVQVSIRSPWGEVYSAISDASGMVDVPVDWTNTGINPHSAGVVEQLAAGWLVFTEEERAIPLKIGPSQAERIRSEIANANNEVGAPNEKATLSAELDELYPLVVGVTGTLRLAIQNSGPQPAYRVTAKLRSSVDALHGHQLSFGRINPGKTKIRTQEVTLPSKLSERSALVIADVSYFNGERFDIRKKFDLVLEVKATDPTDDTTERRERERRAPELAADCQLATAEVAPGERVRIDCELRNLTGKPASELTITVSVGGHESKNLAPQSLPAAGSEKLELVGFASKELKQGAQVPVVVRVGAPGLAPVERTLLVRIASFATGCKSRLTRDEYKVKRKRLQAALDSGALTQQEFDKYDSDLLSCLE